MAKKTQYSAQSLSVLEGLEAVRKRPGMYIGSTDSKGLMHCLWEIVDNSVDEALAGHCDEINIILHSDNSVEVQDNGRGIPIDIEPKTGLSGVEVVLTKLHAGGKFGGSSYGATGGLHGVGASVVNALSARMDVEVDRAGKTYGMSFRRGVPGKFFDEGEKQKDSKFKRRLKSAKKDIEVVGKAKRGKTGTRTRYWADSQIFMPNASFSYDQLIERVRQTTFLVPGLKIIVKDERVVIDAETGEARPIPEAAVFFHEGGITEFVDHLSDDDGITDIWRLSGSGTFVESVPVLDDSGNMQTTEVERTCDVDIALRWGIGYETKIRSFVNIIATPKGGTHQTGFEQALVRTLRKYTEANSRKLKLGKDKVDKEDVLAGLTAVLTVRLAEPQFEGQTKEILGTAAVRNIVANVVRTELVARFENPPRGTKQQVDKLLEKVVSEMKSRISARLHKETQRRKSALENSSMPAKLADCRSNEVESSELFIVEGDSALGTAKLARTSDFQALLPIRGKILNVQKASLADMLANAECAAIIQVIGAGSGKSFDLEAARYGKVVLMTDADVDGAHIRTLLLTLFFRYMRPLVEAGYVYAAVPPLHRVEINAKRGKKAEVRYTYSEQELQDLLADLKATNRTYKEPIQRYKGLGEMDANQLAETTMDLKYRTLRRIRIADAEKAERAFSLLMGSEVLPRKNFIIAGAEEVTREAIDS
ncbi:MAG: DNA topoisomerase IV subunit B [Micrococcaceae bacterium]